MAFSKAAEPLQTVLNGFLKTVGGRMCLPGGKVSRSKQKRQQRLPNNVTNTSVDLESAQALISTGK